MPKIKTEQKKAKTIVKKAANTGLSIPVYDPDGKEAGVIELPKEIFATEANPKLVAQYVRVYLANQRKGNASTKTRGEVIGSTRKIYRQKGTGRARHGDIKAPIFVGGGVVGGPKPRDFSLNLSKKQKRRVLFYALTQKRKDKEMFGLSEKFLKLEPKTKLMVNFLKAVGSNKEKVLMVFPKIDKNNLVLAGRNIENLKLTDAGSINAYDILNSKKIMLLKGSLEIFKKNFIKNEN